VSGARGVERSKLPPNERLTRGGQGAIDALARTEAIAAFGREVVGGQPLAAIARATRNGAWAFARALGRSDLVADTHEKRRRRSSVLRDSVGDNLQGRSLSLNVFCGIC